MGIFLLSKNIWGCDSGEWGDLVDRMALQGAQWTTWLPRLHIDLGRVYEAGPVGTLVEEITFLEG